MVLTAPSTSVYLQFVATMSPGAEGTALERGLVLDKVGVSCQYASTSDTGPEILDGLIRRPPVFEPNFRATYSNMNFVLLGLALENLLGLSYEEIVNRTILQPLGMKHSRLSKPLDGEGVIPNLTNDWNADIGTYGP